MKLSVRGFAVASALVWAGAVLFVLLWGLVRPGYGAAFLEMTASVYPGYDPGGGFGEGVVAVLYGLVDGAIGGALFAWIYNLAVGGSTGRAST